jgi:hypothetical protein
MSFALTIVLSILGLCSFGIVIGYLVSVGMAIKKFDCMESTVQEKLLLLEYYMAVVRNFSKEDLIKIGKLSDEDLTYLNTIHLYTERIQTIKKKINNNEE